MLCRNRSQVSLSFVSTNAIDPVHARNSCDLHASTRKSVWSERDLYGVSCLVLRLFPTDVLYLRYLDAQDEKCGYAGYIDKYLTYPPTGPLPLPNGTSDVTAECDLFSAVFVSGLHAERAMLIGILQEAALRVNPAFNLYRISDSWNGATGNDAPRLLTQGLTFLSRRSLGCIRFPGKFAKSAKPSLLQQNRCSRRNPCSAHQLGGMRSCQCLQHFGWIRHQRAIWTERSSQRYREIATHCHPARDIRLRLDPPRNTAHDPKHDMGLSTRLPDRTDTRVSDHAWSRCCWNGSHRTQFDVSLFLLADLRSLTPVLVAMCKSTEQAT